MTTFTVEGAAVRGIPSFYDEINRVFMGGEDWRLGDSLDALDDLLYGGFGALAVATDPLRVVWRDAEASRQALGRSETVAYYRRKLEQPELFDQERFRRRLAEAESGTGPTYFDIVLDVFAGHPEVDLVLE